jgi:hypothetical protein
MSKNTSASLFRPKKKDIFFGLFTALLASIFPIVSMILKTNVYGPFLYRFMSSNGTKHLYGVVSGVIHFINYSFFTPFFMISEIYHPDIIETTILFMAHVLLWFFFGVTLSLVCKRFFISISCLFTSMIFLYIFNFLLTFLFKGE